MEFGKLLEYLSEGNNLTTQFIAKTSDFKQVCKYIVAFSNTLGGKLFIGVDVSNCHIVGSSLNTKQINQLIEMYCQPGINVSVETISKNDKSILYVTVPEGSRKPYYYNEDMYIMENDGPRLATKEEAIDIAHYNKIEEEPSESFQATSPIDTQNVTTSQVETTETRKINTITEELVNIRSNKDDTSVNNVDTHSNDSTINPNKSIPPTTENVNHYNSSIDLPNDLNEVEDSTNSIFQFDIEQPIDPKNLNKRQLETLHVLKTNEIGSIKNKEYRATHNVSHKTAHIELVDLVKKNFLVPQGSGRSTCYVLANKSD